MAFGVCGLTDRSKIHRQSQKRVLSSFFDSFSLSNSKTLPAKAFLKVTLVSLTDRSRIHTQPQKSVLESFFDSFSLSNSKILSTKAFFKATLVSLTLRARTVFFNF